MNRKRQYRTKRYAVASLTTGEIVKEYRTHPDRLGDAA